MNINSLLFIIFLLKCYIIYYYDKKKHPASLRERCSRIESVQGKMQYMVIYFRE